MTVDELVAEIFRIQLEHDPHSDPGDMHITIQDDTNMVRVQQEMFFAAEPIESFAQDFVLRQGIMRPTIQSALEHYLEEVKNGDR
jgi:hypothetical protein